MGITFSIVLQPKFLQCLAFMFSTMAAGLRVRNITRTWRNFPGGGEFSITPCHQRQRSRTNNLGGLLPQFRLVWPSRHGRSTIIVFGRAAVRLLAADMSQSGARWPLTYAISAGDWRWRWGGEQSGAAAAVTGQLSCDFGVTRRMT